MTHERILNWAYFYVQNIVDPNLGSRYWTQLECARAANTTVNTIAKYVRRIRRGEL